MTAAANRILIVDDDSDLLSGLIRQLGDRFDIVTAESGEEALRKFQTDEPFAVVLSDVRMPGMGGIEFLERLKELAPETMRLALTGHIEQQATADAINRAKVFSFLIKPVATELLVVTIDGAASHYRQVATERALAAARKQIEQQNQILLDREKVQEEVIHDLSIYQEELRAQNDDLLKSRNEIETINSRYRDIYDNSPAGIFIFDKFFTIRGANSTGLSMIGNPSAGGMGIQFKKFVEKDSRQILNNHLYKVRAEGRASCELWLNPGHGAPFPVILESVETGMNWDDGWQCLTTAVDISERKLAEDNLVRALAEQEKLSRSLASSEHFIRMVTNNAGAAISYWGADCRCRFANQPYFEWFNHLPEAVIGKTAREFLGDELYRKSESRINGVLQGEPQQFERVMHKGNGEEVHAQINYVPDFGAEKVVQGFIVVVHDVTTIKRAELAAEAAARAKADFLANMSHEIRTPMNGIIGMVHLALGADEQHKQRGYVEMIGQSAQRLLAVIDDILDFSKVEAGKLDIEQEPFDVNCLISDMLATVSKGACDKGLEVIVDIAPEVPPVVIGDQLRIGQILLNYLSNAIKFTERGKITVRVEVERAIDTDGLLRFSVTDTGIGLTAEQKANLFQSFQQAESSTTRRFGGTGLGLAIAKNLAGLMGGDVGVDSTPGQGSTFWFSVRIQPSNDMVVAWGPFHNLKGVKKDHAILRGTRVLLAEDDPTNQMVATGLLEAAGMQVDIAANGVRAVEMALARDYEIVLMDMQMPEMDGITATRLIREHDRLAELPVIALTANAMKIHQEQCLAAGMNDFIGKPFQPTQLYSIIQKWVTGAGDADLFGGLADAGTEAPRLPGTINGLDLRAGLRRMAGMEALYVKSLLSFVEQQKDMSARLRQDIADNDAAAAIREAHTLKGAAGIIEAGEVRELATGLEAALAAGDISGGLAWLDRLDAQLDPLLAAINAALEDPSSPSPTALMRIDWQTAYDSGHPVIDNQHRALFDLANALLPAMLSRRPAEELEVMISALAQEVNQHFQDEEKIFTAAEFPMAEKHISIHGRLVDQLAGLVDRFHGGTLGIEDLYAFLVNGLISRHMLEEDLEFFSYLKIHARHTTGTHPK